MVDHIVNGLRWLLRQGPVIFAIYFIIAFFAGALHGWWTARSNIIDGFLVRNVRSILAPESGEKKALTQYWFEWKLPDSEDYVTHIYDVTTNKKYNRPPNPYAKAAADTEEDNPHATGLNKITEAVEAIKDRRTKAGPWPPLRHPTRVGKDTSYHAMEMCVTNLKVDTIKYEPGLLDFTVKNALKEMNEAGYSPTVTRPLGVFLELLGHAPPDTSGSHVIDRIKGIFTGGLFGFWVGRKVPIHLHGHEADIRARLDKDETWFKLEKNIWDVKYSMLLIVMEKLNKGDPSLRERAVLEGLIARAKKLADDTNSKTYQDLGVNDFVGLDAIYTTLKREGLWLEPEALISAPKI